MEQPSPDRACGSPNVAFGCSCSLPIGHGGDHSTVRGSITVSWKRRERLDGPKETR